MLFRIEEHHHFFPDQIFVQKFFFLKKFGFVLHEKFRLVRNKEFWFFRVRKLPGRQPQEWFQRVEEFSGQQPQIFHERFTRFAGQ